MNRNDNTALSVSHKGVYGLKTWIAMAGLFSYSLSTLLLHGQGQQQMLGLFLCVCFVATGLKLFLIHRPVEPILYSLWVLWCLTGLGVAVSINNFWQTYHVVLQMAVLIWAVAGLSAFLVSARPVAAGLAVGGLVQIVYVWSGLGSPQLETLRVRAMTGNPNSLAIWLTLSCGAVLMFWNAPTPLRRYLRLGAIAYVGLAFVVVAKTGSRKGFLALLFLIGTWGAFVLYGKRRSNWQSVILVCITAACLAIAYNYAMEETVTGKRFEMFMEKGRGDLLTAAQHHVRYDLYMKGVEMFSEHPILGVGLGNFTEYVSSGLYSHSDYIEPLATTGIVGFVCYMSGYAVLLWRLRRLLRYPIPNREEYDIKLMIALVATVLLIGLGAPHHVSQVTWVLLSSFIGYSFSREWQLSRRCKRGASHLRKTDIE